MKFALLLAGLLMFGCSAEPEEEDDSSVLYDAAREPLDKAESVEETLLESAEKRDDAIEEAED
jgi:hypothetical protein